MVALGLGLCDLPLRLFLPPESYRTTVKSTDNEEKYCLLEILIDFFSTATHFFLPFLVLVLHKTAEGRSYLLRDILDSLETLPSLPHLCVVHVRCDSRTAYLLQLFIPTKEAHSCSMTADHMLARL